MQAGSCPCSSIVHVYQAMMMPCRGNGTRSGHVRKKVTRLASLYQQTAYGASGVRASSCSGSSTLHVFQAMAVPFRGNETEPGHIPYPEMLFMRCRQGSRRAVVHRERACRSPC